MRAAEEQRAARTAAAARRAAEKRGAAPDAAEASVPRRPARDEPEPNAADVVIDRKRAAAEAALAEWDR
jgi:hypothetical protein